MKAMLLILSVIAASFGQLFAAPLPGQTLVSDPRLQKDITANLFTAEKAVAGRCKQSRLVDTRVTRQPTKVRRDRGRGSAVTQWTERWTIDRCGKKVFYTINLYTLGPGGTIFGIEVPLK